MVALLLALLQAAPSGGEEIRVKRESDPAAVCMVMTAVESMKTPSPVTTFDRNPDVKRADDVATVTWKDARARGKAVKVTCQMNFQTREVTSVQVAGKEILTGPQPF
jgi:hypothetical protein